MVISVGINGFGRVGRIIFRSIAENEDIVVAALNDPAVDAKYICYLIKFDSTHGKFKGNVIQSHNEIIVNGNPIKVFNKKQPSEIPWHEVNIDYVIETSGMFTSYEKAGGHLKSNVKRVIVTSPSADIPMIILGVNEEDLLPDGRAVSCASSTLYCLALVCAALAACGGVEAGFVTSVHAMTSSLKPLDGLCVKGKHWRDHRGIHQNIIPTKTGVCKALGKILPQLKDKLSGLVYRVPIVDVSVLDLAVRMSKPTSLDEIISKIEEASATTMKNLVKVSDDGSVSSDFIGDSHSCVLDAQCCQQLGDNFFKLVCWYENEFSFACRVIDTIRFCEKNDAKSKEASGTPRPKCDCVERNKSMGEIIKHLPGSAFFDTALRFEVPKPERYHNGELKKRSEVFKILYNDDVKDYTQRIQKSFSADTQVRLAKVKQEFSKMVHKTEDLLRKSQSNKINLRSVEKEIAFATNTDTIAINTKRTLSHNIEPLPYTDDYKLVNKFENIKSSTTKYNYLKDYSKVQIRNKNERKPSTSSEEEFLKYETACETSCINMNTDKASVETLIGKASHSRNFIKKYTSNDTSKSDFDMNDVTPIYNIYCKSKAKQVNISDDLKVTNTEKHNNNTDKPIQTIVAPHDNLKGVESTDYWYDTTTFTEYNDDSKLCEMNIKSKNSTKANILINRKHKQDVLEKLDSASDTDSELSLRLRERKSEVIQLSDLTTSHEELNKLDKICRIIEISDELSDRLFSPLQTAGVGDTNTEWSFKDFCEKIKLDDFCDDVFGKSVL